MLEDIQSEYIWKNFLLAKKIGLPKIALEILNFEVEINRNYFIQFIKRQGFSIRTSGVNSQIITTNEKRIEIVSDYYEKYIYNSILQIPLFSSFAIQYWLKE